MGVGMPVFYKRMSRQSGHRFAEKDMRHLRKLGPFLVQRNRGWLWKPQDVHGLAHYATK
jgi:hypothetical protein